MFQEKRQVAKEKLIEMEEEMAEATAQLKAREAEKVEKVSSVRLVLINMHLSSDGSLSLNYFQNLKDIYWFVLLCSVQIPDCYTWIEEAWHASPHSTSFWTVVLYGKSQQRLSKGCQYNHWINEFKRLHLNTYAFCAIRLFSTIYCTNFNKPSRLLV